MPSIWIVAEVRDGALQRVTRELITVGAGLGGSITVVALGHGVRDALGQLPVDSVLAVDDERLERFSADGWAKVVASLAGERTPDVILGSATARGRDLIPRIAAALGVETASDVVEVERGDGAELICTRPIYAGKAIARVALRGTPAVITVRPNSFAPAESQGQPVIEDVALGDYDPRAVVTSVKRSAGERPDVSEAEIIVSGGRGMGGPEHFTMLEELADALGAGVGASRAVVDAGWRPHGDQVGQTGKTVSPNLYVACGISGAVQHLAGMKTAKTIVAINKDPEAPIFAVADYGIVGDVFEVVPAFTEAVRALKGG